MAEKAHELSKNHNFKEQLQMILQEEKKLKHFLKKQQNENVNYNEQVSPRSERKKYASSGSRAQRGQTRSADRSNPNNTYGQEGFQIPGQKRGMPSRGIKSNQPD